MKESLNIVRRLIKIRQRLILVPVLPMLTTLMPMLLLSCSSVDMSEMSPEQVSLTVNISKQSPTIVTRAISDAIDNITILVFNGQGNLIGSAYTSTSPTSVTLPVRFGAGCTICVIANTGSSSYLDGISTLTELRAKVTTPVASATTLAGKTNEILYGEISGVTINSSTPSQSVILKRLYSRYTFTITPSSDITITDYQLCNVPNECFIASGNTVNPTTGYSGLNYTSVTTSASAGSVVTAGPYYVYENLAGKNSSLTASEQRTSTNAPSCASYILINAKKDTGLGLSWKSTYRIYLGGVTSATTPVADCTDFNIYRGYDYNCNISISGSGTNDARATYINGQYLFSDGTWGVYDANKTVIGVIFATTTSSADKANNYTHGYAMALQNAGSSTTTYQWYTSNSGNPTGSLISTPAQIMADKDGYNHTGTIQTTGYTSGIAAKSYIAKDKSGNNVTAPSGTSGWYLPSAGQWYDIYSNLGGMVASSGVPYTGSSAAWLRWYSGDDSSGKNYTSLCVSAINVYLNALKTNGYKVDLFTNSGEVYWSSTEYSANYAYDADFVTFGVGVYAALKTDFYRVRPVIAF